ncbi:hypothetical protein UFOVP968_11 [uncultured Caudovirales phage]|uniref:Uncharacterized protein n=1 Tax=uncultured Caudovirales phage TaxID=2100421 RepID=A0A6J5PPQ6_9CAUD|nr:hypothetical protein UFOVP968_11 [uncultured Caudovirales phage]CAB4186106.1 hypothetical protein UFOVP1133_17 [uncultured Caudovirales phage]CAB4192241.1 hypothetical protein UFOVP1249_8 [uncultured Caudovirales phage]CAB4217377.1 hypothetical protein UFOVP1494_26 [uncultured Caudovirales phage]CAB5230951.1 hypothetical protein UFOVP1583_8 [uncultured Caudovirales phage]
MSAEAIATLLVAILAVLGAFVGLVRWMVKSFLMELKPNGGGSLSDKVTRLENRVDEIYRILVLGDPRP